MNQFAWHAQIEKKWTQYFGIQRFYRWWLQEDSDIQRNLSDFGDVLTK